jgi:hypothetical protein
VELVLVGLDRVLVRTLKLERLDQRLETNLEISELSKLLAAMIETAKIWLSLLVDDTVGTDVSALSESLSTDLAVVRSLTSVAPLMGLYKVLVSRLQGSQRIENLLSDSQVEKSYVRNRALCRAIGYQLRSVLGLKWYSHKA